MFNNHRQRWVRDAMNECMGIVHDKEVSTKETAASQKEIEDWLDGKKSATGPGIDPMRIDWFGDVKSSWNYTIFVHFAKSMQSKTSDLLKGVPPPDKHELKEIFFGRLERMRVIVLKTQPQERKSGDVETEEQIWARLNGADQVQRKNATATTRRQTVSVHTYYTESSSQG